MHCSIKKRSLRLLAKTNRAMILHEASLTGGIGGELSAIIAEEAFEWLDAPVIRVASIDSIVPFAPRIEDYYLPSLEETVDACRKLANY
ncbi:MAG: transketolase C-terminal domain-containing protein [Pyrinomonadaceae bacterium]